MRLLWSFIFALTVLSCSEIQSDKDFATTQDVSKIFLANSNGSSIVLEKMGKKWMFDKKNPCRKDMMDILLQTIKKVQVNYPVSKKRQNQIIREISATHVKVSLFDGEKRLKTFYVGGPTQDQMGTYLYMEGGKKPYVCHIPGFEGYLTPRFFTDSNLWLDRTVFSVKSSDIKSLSIEYDTSLHWMESFKIDLNTEGKFQISNLKGKIKEVRQEQILQYLDFFKNLQVEGFANESAKKDSLEKTTPFCKLSLEKTDGSSSHMKAYFMDLNQRSKTQFDRKGKKLEFDLDRMYAEYGNPSQFAIIQMFVFGKVFQNYSTFQ